MLELRVVANGRAIPLPHLPRLLGEATAARVIATHIESLIAMLDDLGGDPDFEDDDPSGDPCDQGEQDEWRPEGVALAKPIYGVDQTAGPTNEKEAVRAWRRSFMVR